MTNGHVIRSVAKEEGRERWNRRIWTSKQKGIMVNKSRVIETITSRKEDRQVGAISTMKYGYTKLLDT